MDVVVQSPSPLALGAAAILALLSAAWLLRRRQRRRRRAWLQARVWLDEPAWPPADRLDGGGGSGARG